MRIVEADAGMMRRRMKMVKGGLNWGGVVDIGYLEKWGWFIDIFGRAKAMMEMEIKIIRAYICICFFLEKSSLVRRVVWGL